MVEITYAGVTYATDPDVYVPNDDTFLLADVVERLPPGRLLDIGTGCGFVALVAARCGHKVVATDVNPTAVALAKKNAAANGLGIDVRHADLFTGLDVREFDAITFNPPYLPTKTHERLPGPLNAAFDGGPTGRSVLERFLKRLPPDPPPVYIVASSLLVPDALSQLVRARGLEWAVVAERALPMERLFVARVAPTRKH